MGRSSFSILSKAVFVFYCTAVGVYLLLRPWAGVPVSGLAASGFFRGFVSGLGLIHLAAGVVDLFSLSRDLAEREAESRG